MSDSKVSGRARMAEVLRAAIADPEVLRSLSEKDMGVVANRAMHMLSGSDVRGLIYRCFTSDENTKGLVVVREAIGYAARMRDYGDATESAEIVEAAVGALGMLAPSNESARNTLFLLLQHEDPTIAAAVVKNLGHSTDIDNFKNICQLLLRDEREVHLHAARYLEDCTRDAAFRKRDDRIAIENDAEEFLRQALLHLERAYEQLKRRDDSMDNVRKRISMLVAMIYNELLDSTDYKRQNNEDVEERIYYTLEQHLNEDLAPAAMPNLCKLLGRPEIEDGIKRSALNTIGRMSKREGLREQVSAWLADFLAREKSDLLRRIASELADALASGRAFSSVPPPADAGDRRSIIPRTLGGLGRDNDEN